MRGKKDIFTEAQLKIMRNLRELGCTYEEIGFELGVNRKTISRTLNPKIKEREIQYYYKNKEIILEKKKVYALNHINSIKEQHLKYREANKEKLCTRRKELYEINREQRKNTQNKYYHANKELINQQRKDKYHMNKEEINKKRREKYVANKEEINKKRREKYASRPKTVESLLLYATYLEVRLPE